MKRKKTSIIAKWKREFADSKTIIARKEKKTQAVHSLVLIKQEPVTFRLSRFENPDDFDRMLFVIKACARSGDLPYKTVLHIEQTRTGSRLVATDGLRFHVAEISKKIKSGDYKPYLRKDLISLGKPLNNIKFPTWAKVIPEKTERRGVINLANSGLGKDKKETENLSLAFNSFVKETGEPVNLRYLDDLTKREWTVYCQNEKRKAIVLKEKSRKPGEPNGKEPMAVILPIPQAA